MSAYISTLSASLPFSKSEFYDSSKTRSSSKFFHTPQKIQTENRKTKLFCKCMPEVDTVNCLKLDRFGRKESSEQQFVTWFREAWPYIRAFRGSTFVVAVSSEIVKGSHLDTILQDISLLHGLGIKIILIPGTHIQVDQLLAEKGSKVRYVGPYRVTDGDSLEAAKEAAGRIHFTIQAKLSPGPPILNLHRHVDNSRWHELGVCVAGGNFLAAKRRGVVEGIDYGATGEVKKIHIENIRECLDRDCVVLVSNLGYSSSGELLNCNAYEVATACALALEADKLICILDGQIVDEHNRLIRFMTIDDADLLLRRRAKKSDISFHWKDNWNGNRRATFQNGVGFDSGNGLWSGGQGSAIGGEERSGRDGYISELAAAVYVCRGGVQRVQLVDGTLGGSLLLELFTGEGVGTMVATDAWREHGLQE